MPVEVTTQVVNNQISETHCRHICKLINRKDLIKRFETLYNQLQDKWTPEQIERFEQELFPRKH